MHECQPSIQHEPRQAGGEEEQGRSAVTYLIPPELPAMVKKVCHPLRWGSAFNSRAPNLPQRSLVTSLEAGSDNKGRPPMRLLFSDGKLLRRGGLVSLIHSEKGWYVIGPGFVCLVEGLQEGREVIANLKANATRRGQVIAAACRCDTPPQDHEHGGRG